MNKKGLLSFEGNGACEDSRCEVKPQADAWRCRLHHEEDDDERQRYQHRQHGHQPGHAPLEPQHEQHDQWQGNEGHDEHLADGVVGGVSHQTVHLVGQLQDVPSVALGVDQRQQGGKKHDQRAA